MVDGRMATSDGGMRPRRVVDEADEDARWMDEALTEAQRGIGLTSPNPAVGAVIVRDGECIGRGWHERTGGPHAEVRALEAAGPGARGATMYVTLEPCCTYGRTPPCTDAICAAGVARVVIGCEDPNPSHEGRGVTLLRENGIDVRAGVREEACRALNEAFFHWVTTGRPFLVLKLATTLDGRIATWSGDSKWVTGEAARSEVQRLRRWSDAIIVGGETVRSDNPSLTVREPPDWPRQPLRFVWSRGKKESFPDTLSVCQPKDGRMAEFVRPQGRKEWRAWLDSLGDRQVTTVLAEGGGELAAELLNSRAVDKVVWFVAPKILGGRTSRPAVGGPAPATLSDCIEIEAIQVECRGQDLMLTGYPRRKASRVYASDTELN